MEPLKACWCGLCQYEWVGLLVTAHKGDAISPGGFVRVTWGAELAGRIAAQPHGWVDIPKSRN
jgi:hypothetical protein